MSVHNVMERTAVKDMNVTLPTAPSIRRMTQLRSLKLNLNPNASCASGLSEPTYTPTDSLRPKSTSTDPEIPNSRSPDSRFGRETGKGIPDSRLGRNRESGTPVSRFGRERESGSRLAANREIGDTPR